MIFMEKFYQTTLNALKDANNDVSYLSRVTYWMYVVKEHSPHLT